jgi:hypothetical protein
MTRMQNAEDRRQKVTEIFRILTSEFCILQP